MKGEDRVGVILWFDGGIKPMNPGGVATYGWVIERDGRQIASGYGVAAEDSTNNVAEYAGLIAGLEALVERGLRRVEVRGDSMLVVKQVNGWWRCHAEHLRPLLARAQGLAEGRHLRIRWVPREQNEAADALATLAYEEAEDERVYRCLSCGREWCWYELFDECCGDTFCGGTVIAERLKTLL